MKRFTISWMPWAGKDMASSRLRAYAMHEAFDRDPSLSIQSFMPGAGYMVSDSDVVIAQKISDPKDFEIVARHRGLKVYDFDDPMAYGVIAMADDICDVFITDTEGHRDWLKNLGSTKPCYVVPDCADCEAPQSLLHGNNGAVWFGNKENSGPALFMASKLLDQDVKITFISNLTECHWEPRIELVKWDMHSFATNLRRSGTCILSHRGQLPGKSANKMVAAICLGLPCVVEAGCCYEELAIELMMDELVTKNSWTVVDAFKVAEDQSYRAHTMPYAQAIAWGKYNPPAIARRLADALRKELG